ncbi:bifunctional phosphoserine phosphatase/homoserine phosphotransferase ThrH [Spirochaeta lutea]|uniref:bifunctional phosphoserine phosphatase/homoserine phosphotransferase ThrH n=1 Tax=Spirochaeta lutea TaxID=1480694 RepID=UPI0005695844|nr:bifunctional phosphoserine phosphatase/homoserine phosphotransferase ThrH [Spirochaeta lutea]
MNLICLDLEGVMVPEIWINLAKKTGIASLERTTRDEPDYSKLMNGRLEILREHNLTIHDIHEVINSLEPLPGAVDFLDTLREQAQVVILSDTFQQFAAPLMRKLRWPTLLCNDLVIDDHGVIQDFKLRQADGKRRAVEGFQSMGLSVTAAGDSYNDLSMIKAAQRGAFFRPPQRITLEEPDYPVFTEYPPFVDFLLNRI